MWDEIVGLRILLQKSVKAIYGTDSTDLSQIDQDEVAEIRSVLADLSEDLLDLREVCLLNCCLWNRPHQIRASR